jgi:hypothetical protein
VGLNSQEEDELYYVTSFLETSGLQARLEPQPPGSGPDFLLVEDSRLTVLEVTELYRKPPVRRQSGSSWSASSAQTCSARWVRLTWDVGWALTRVE